MDINYVNGLLESTKQKLESLDPRRKMMEEQKKPSEHSGSRMSAAKKRLEKLYSKLTAGRSESNQVKSTGAKR